MHTLSIPILTVNSKGESVFKALILSLNDYNGMFISDRQEALNFRHRWSAVGYESNWHLAGDPTLIIVQQGSIELRLKNGEAKIFSVGEQFVAADYLPEALDKSENAGHKARVIGNNDFSALHIKLSDDPAQWTASQSKNIV